jgi:hypothetical protein
MKRLSGLDGMFLHLDTRTPMRRFARVARLAQAIAAFLDDVGAYARRIPLAPGEPEALNCRCRWPIRSGRSQHGLDAHIRRIVAEARHAGQLEACVGELHSTPLDRNRPLWSVCIIEGLKGRQVGYYTNIHHAVIDGQAGVELAKAIFDLRPGRDASRVPDRPVGRGRAPWPGTDRGGPTRCGAVCELRATTARARTQARCGKACGQEP